AQMETLFGYRGEELAGHPLEIVLPERLRAAHAGMFAHYIHAAHPRPMGQGLPLFGRRKDGSEFPVDVSLRPILIDHVLHVIGAIRDMTVQRLAEQERMQINERLRQQDKLLHLAHDAILVRDPASHIISWNEGAEKLYGWVAREVEGKVTHSLLQTQFPASQEEVSQILERDGQWEGEIIHTCRDGTKVIVASRQVLLLDDRGAPSAILEINRDVTAFKEAETLKDQFISLATHELRTPVTVIAGYIDLLLARAARRNGNELDEWQREKLREIKRATGQLAKLTEDLLDITRVQAGQFHLQFRPA